MNREIKLDKNQLADIMLGSVIAAMKDVPEPERLAMRDEHIKHYRKLAQDIINDHGEEEIKIVIPH